MADQVKKTQQSHFVLVHGACHGAWCWYKVKPLLQSTGHRVTVLDLVGSGIHPKPIQDAPTFCDYTEPLLNFLASLPQNGKVILVGHSLGGLNLALAMENFPQKVSVAVFLTAFMPDTVNHSSFVVDKLIELLGGAWLDTQFSAPDDPQNQQLTMLFGPKFLSSVLYQNSPIELIELVGDATLDTQFFSTPNDPQNQQLTMLFGPKFLSSVLYQNSPIEDLELAKALLRPSSLYVHDLSKARKFTAEKYGSVTRVFAVCDEDKVVPVEFQHWMVSNNPPHSVIEIKGADHMPMFSKPQQLCQCLSEIALKYV